jgi:hypothetical protein
MAFQADKANGPLDISALLDLLNASDDANYADDVSVETPEETLPHDQQTVLDLRTVGKPLSFPASDSVEAQIAHGDSSESRARAEAAEHQSALQELEDRLAAHVVQGMAKAKKQS